MIIFYTILPLLYFKMVHSESATASIGIKIKIADLLEQLNDTTYQLIAEMLADGKIQDENEFFNNVYTEIANKLRHDKTPLKTEKQQKELIYSLKNTWSYIIDRFTDERIPNTYDGSLYEQYIIVPTWTILETTRWGWNREGTNVKSIPLDFDIDHRTAPDALVDEKYKIIKNWSVVFMLSLHT